MIYRLTFGSDEQNRTYYAYWYEKPPGYIDAIHWLSEVFPGESFAHGEWHITTVYVDNV